MADDDIEPTLAMVQAGAAILAGQGDRTNEEIVRIIWREMVLIKIDPQRSDPGYDPEEAAAELERSMKVPRAFLD